MVVTLQLVPQKLGWQSSIRAVKRPTSTLILCTVIKDSALTITLSKVISPSP